MNKKCLKKIVIIILAVYILYLIIQSVYDRKIFRKYVCNPIPKSVKNVKADRPWEASGHRYVMRFKISKEDIKLILDSKPFEQMSNYISYKHGSLRWKGSNKSESIRLYRGYGPFWFRPQRLKNPKVFKHEEMFGKYNDREHMQLLIYNEKSSTVYFVEYQQGIW